MLTSLCCPYATSSSPGKADPDQHKHCKQCKLEQLILRGMAEYRCVYYFCIND